jgi:hypothetical protein
MYYNNPYDYNTLYYYNYYNFLPYYNRVIPHEIIHLVGFYVDMELDNAQKICNAKLDFVSPVPDETQANYRDVTYAIQSAGQPYTYHTKTRNIVRITRSGEICS